MRTPSVKNMQIMFYKTYIKKYDIIIPNTYFTSCSSELDMACLRPSGFVDEIEIKLSRDDFIRDFKKTTTVWKDASCKKMNKHEALAKGLLPTNRFSFYMPEEIYEQGIVIPTPCIKYAGLYLFRYNKVGIPVIREVIKPKLLHRNKISMREKHIIGMKMACKYWSNL